MPEGDKEISITDTDPETGISIEKTEKIDQEDEPEIILGEPQTTQSDNAQQEVIENANNVRRGIPGIRKMFRAQRMNSSLDREPLIAGREQARAQKEELERNNLFDHVDSRLRSFSTAYDLDRQRRIEREYGSGFLGKFNAGLENIDLRGKSSLTDEIKARAKKILMKSGISFAVGVTACVVLGAAVAPVMPVLLGATAGGMVGRAAIEGVRTIRGKERHEREDIEAGNKVFMEYLLKYYEDTEDIKLKLAQEHGDEYDVESDPEYVERVTKIFEMLEDDSKRRVIRISKPDANGEIKRGFEAVDFDAENSDEMINLGEKSKALRSEGKKWETIADITSAITSIGGGIAAKVLVGNRLAAELGHKTAAPLIERLTNGDTVGPFDFDHDRAKHLIKLVDGKVRFFTDATQQISYFIGSSLEGVKSSIISGQIAKYAFQQVTSIAAVAAASAGQTLLRPGIVINRSDEEIEKQISDRIEETKRGIRSILSKQEDSIPATEIPSNRTVAEIDVDTEIEHEDSSVLDLDSDERKKPEELQHQPEANPIITEPEAESPEPKPEEDPETTAPAVPAAEEEKIEKKPIPDAEIEKQFQKGSIWKLARGEKITIKGTDFNTPGTVEDLLLDPDKDYEIHGISRSENDKYWVVQFTDAGNPYAKVMLVPIHAFASKLIPKSAEKSEGDISEYQKAIYEYLSKYGEKIIEHRQLRLERNFIVIEKNEEKVTVKPGQIWEWNVDGKNIPFTIKSIESRRNGMEVEFEGFPARKRPLEAWKNIFESAKLKE